jgi:hypothetical protein
MANEPISPSQVSSPPPADEASARAQVLANGSEASLGPPAGDELKTGAAPPFRA